MPGEVRKFRRRRIVAFIPVCNCEREIAALHTSVSDGISTIDVSVDSITGVPVGKGEGVNVGAGVFVPVGDGIKTAVAVSPPEGADVPVGDGIGRKVAVSPFEVNVPVADGTVSEVDVDALEAEVCVVDGNGGAVTGGVLDVDVLVGDEIGGATVVETSLVAVTEIAVPVGVGVHDCGAFAGIQNSRQINISKSMSAITSLNRS